MYKITKEQIEQVLSVVYQTNISAQAFDELKQFFIKLPQEEVKEETKVDNNKKE